jgi:hypothetical protein
VSGADCGPIISGGYVLFWKRIDVLLDFRVPGLLGKGCLGTVEVKLRER